MLLLYPKIGPRVHECTASLPNRRDLLILLAIDNGEYLIGSHKNVFHCTNSPVLFIISTVIMKATSLSWQDYRLFRKQKEEKEKKISISGFKLSFTYKAKAERRRRQLLFVRRISLSDTT